MACRQAFDIDLVAFLAQPRAEGFAAFRAHYPTCVDCAGEVRAWTEIHESLGAGQHPTAAALANYSALAAGERAAIDRHAATCASCREELRMLEAFDPAAMALPASPPETSRRRAERDAGRPGWMEAIARLLWHPAFAYGVALMVVAPLLWRTQGPGQTLDLPIGSGVGVSTEETDRFDGVQSIESVATTDAVVVEERVVLETRNAPADVQPVPVPEEVPARAKRSRSAGDSIASLDERRSAPVTLPNSEPVASHTGARDLGESVAETESVPEVFAESVARAKVLPTVELQAGVEDLASAPAPAPNQERTRDTPDTESKALRKSAPRSALAASEFAADDSSALSVARGAVVAAESEEVLPELAPIALASAPARISIRVPVPPGPRRDVEVVIRATDGGAPLVRGAAAVPERSDVAVDVPRDWLAPGIYRVELRDGDLRAGFTLPVVER